jgi:hypothetical protein
MSISNSTDNVPAIGAGDKHPSPALITLNIEGSALRTHVRESVRSAIAITEKEERSIETEFMRRMRMQMAKALLAERNPAPDGSPTLFGRLEEIRANVKRACADVTRLRASIKGRASVGGERTPAQDMRIQLHSDQPIRATSETAHGEY